MWKQKGSSAKNPLFILQEWLEVITYIHPSCKGLLLFESSMHGFKIEGCIILVG